LRKQVNDDKQFTRAHAQAEAPAVRKRMAVVRWLGRRWMRVDHVTWITTNILTTGQYVVQNTTLQPAGTVRTPPRSQKCVIYSNSECT
jgi:hypothetical protein